MIFAGSRPKIHGGVVAGAEAQARESCTRGKNGGNVWSLHVINIGESKHRLLSPILRPSACVSIPFVCTEYFRKSYLSTFPFDCVVERVRASSVSKGAALVARLLPVERT